MVYEIVVVPMPRPVTFPEAFTVPTAVLELDQVPPAIALVSAVDEPTHTLVRPVIAPGWVLTVTIAVTKHVPMV